MQFTVDQINENIVVWENIKKKDKQQKQQSLEQSSNSPTEKNVVTNNIPPQPSPEGKSSTNERPRSGI